MSARGWLYTGTAAGITFLVGLVGAMATAGADRTGVMFGVALGFLLQVALFWALMVGWFRDRLWLGYMLGMLGRFLVFGVVAFVAVPQLALPLGPTLFALVGVFWLTTLIEPLYLRSHLPHAS